MLLDFIEGKKNISNNKDIYILDIVQILVGILLFLEDIDILFYVLNLLKKIIMWQSKIIIY